MTCGVTQDLGVFVSGEKPAPLQYTFLDSNGNPIDLTAFTVRFVWRARETDPPAATVGTGALVNPIAGVVEYTWTGVEFGAPGRYQGEFIVGNGTNRWISQLIVWQVRASTGPVPNI